MQATVPYALRGGGTRGAVVKLCSGMFGMIIPCFDIPYCTSSVSLGADLQHPAAGVGGSNLAESIVEGEQGTLTNTDYMLTDGLTWMDIITD
jgi:hypothetical protein